MAHGDRIFADDLARKLVIPSSMHEGRRITSAPMRDIVIQVYGGLLNKQVVARLQALGFDAIGLSGADGTLPSFHLVIQNPAVRECDSRIADHKEQPCR